MRAEPSILRCRELPSHRYQRFSIKHVTSPTVRRKLHLLPLLRQHGFLIKMESLNQRDIHSYNYAALEPDEIRLLKVLPGSNDDLISVMLEHSSLKSLPKYHAVSYVWGTDFHPSPVLVHGYPVTITSNLHAALWEFRRRGSTTDLDFTKIEVWIDALCINQHDSVERAAQVELMGSIYKQSLMLIVWLGAETATSRDAFSAMTRYREIYHSSRVREATEVNEFDRSPKISRKEWRCLGDLYENTYFSRCWVLQEYILGGYLSSTMFFCGSQSAPSLIALLAEMWCNWEEIAAEDVTTEDLCPSCSMAVCHRQRVFLGTDQKFISDHDGQAESSGGREDILQGLVMIQSFQEATNPKDKVYSILGLAREMGLLEADLDGLLVDYTASVESVFSSCVRAIIKMSKRLNILGAACRTTRSLHVKRSWTPDWSQRMPVNERSVVPLTFPRSLRQKASLDVDCIYSFATDLSTLTIRGFSLGMAVHIPLTGKSYEEPFLFEDRVRTAVSFLAQSSKARKQSLWSTLAAFLIADSLSWENDAPREITVDSDKRESWSVKLEQWFDSAHPAYVAKASMFFWNFASKRDLAQHPDDEIIDALDNMFCKLTHADSRFIAENGHIGQCNLHLRSWEDGKEITVTGSRARVGDLLCVILGCANPLILRPAGNGQFLLISEAWVPSIMYGEAMEELKLGQWKLQDFELC